MKQLKPDGCRFPVAIDINDRRFIVPRIPPIKLGRYHFSKKHKWKKS